MDLRTRTLKATNRYHTRPVTLVTGFENAPPDIGARISELSELLHLKTGATPPEHDTANLSRSLCSLAQAFQKAAGLSTFELLEQPPSATLTVAGLVSLFPEEGRQVLKALLRLLDFDPSDKRVTDALDQELAQFSSFWTQRHNRFVSEAATRLNIPWTTLPLSHEPVFALGQGIHRRHFWRVITPETSRIGVLLSSSKQATNRVLRGIGLPVPEQHLAANMDEALTIARRIGWPVVSKPLDSDFGTGITTRITDEESLRSGFSEAQRHGSVILEKQVEGTTHRLLVHQGKFVSAATSDPAAVLGNGINTVKELILQENENRTDGISESGKKIAIDDTAVRVLQRQGMTLRDIPAQGQTILLRFQSNLSTGGTSVTVTDRVHPENRKIAECCAAVLGLDLAGIDLITSDISRPMSQVGGAIIEVNATPGLQMGEAENMLEDMVISHHFPDPSDGRVPIIACLCELAPFARPLANFTFPQTQGSVATVTPERVVVGQLPLSLPGNADLPKRTEAVLANPDTSAAVIILEPRELLGFGLGVDQLSVAVGSPETDPASLEALVVLDRASTATVVFQSGLKDFLSSRKGTGPLWVICLDDKGPESAGHSMLLYSGGPEASVHPANGAPFQTDLPRSDQTAQNALIRIAVGLALDAKAPESRS